MFLQTLFLTSLFSFLILSLFTHPTHSATDTFVYGGCSQIKYAPGTVYESNVNSVLTSIVNSASLSNFNNFKISLPGSTQSDIVYGLYQCRGDLTTSDCRDCVANAVGRVGTLCPDSAGGVVQLEGCMVKYDNLTFLGVEDKSVVVKKCGPPIGENSDWLTRRDALLSYLTAGGQVFKVGGSGNVQGVAQCTQDLNVTECQDCLSTAAGQVKNDCGASAWGDMYLAKCYVQYSMQGYTSRSENKNSNDGGDDINETLAIIIGGIAGVSLLIVFLSFLSKLCDRKDGK